MRVDFATEPVPDYAAVVAALSAQLRNALTPLIGETTVTDEALERMRAAAEEVLADYRDQVTVAVLIHPEDPTRVEIRLMYVQPVDRMTLHLEV